MTDDIDDDYVVYDDDLSNKEIVRRPRTQIPREHRVNADSRLLWLWDQSLITVQSIRAKSPDIEDVMAATLILSATMGSYLPAIELLLQRLEGGAVVDQVVVEQTTLPV